MSFPPSLASLCQTPTPHQDCCLSISLPLIKYLLAQVPKAKPRILSIGSGTGLLESLLAQQNLSLTIHGVEPQPGTANKYLRCEDLILVHGTWSILPREEILTYGILMFVYPREAKLVKGYLDLIACEGSAGDDDDKQQSRNVVVIWAGPKVDWQDWGRDLFEGKGNWKVEVGEQGVREWEIISVCRRMEAGEV